jgi:hypothetical protein
MPITEKQQAENLQAVYTAVARLTFPQLLMAAASLNEHIWLCYQHAELTREEAKNGKH